jgi:hypothetical protein
LRVIPSRLIGAAERAGLKLYNDAALVTAAGSAAYRAGRIFEPSRKLVPTHQRVLVFVKGDPARAGAACWQARERRGRHRVAAPRAALLPADPGMHGEAYRWWAHSHKRLRWPDPAELSPAARREGAQVVLEWRLLLGGPAHEVRIAAYWNADGSYFEGSVCPRPECLRVFKPTSRSQRYCSRACQQAAHNVTRRTGRELARIARGGLRLGGPLPEMRPADDLARRPLPRVLLVLGSARSAGRAAGAAHREGGAAPPDVDGGAGRWPLRAIA